MLDDQAVIRHMDTGLWPVDGNDCDQTPECCFPTGMGRFGLTEMQVGMKPAFNTDHFDGRSWAVLTTPVNYIGSVPLDPFGKGLFFGYEDYGCSNTIASHYLMFSAGPDYDHGDWIYTDISVPYNASNGLASDGDIWRSRKLHDNSPYISTYLGRLRGDFWE